VSCAGWYLQVIGNTGSNSTGEALHATEQGFAVGMHAALQINPYYGKTSKLGLMAHFDAGRWGAAHPDHARLRN
jgi:4-hydroxy-tetrahydrodipicolinate synthase